MTECLPRYATKRSAERKTHGPRIGLIAKALGTPFMPWQQLVADVAGEVDSEGNLVYREIIITVPRQSGKTTLILAELVYRCLGAFGPRQTVVYTAQTRQAARKKWETEQVVRPNQSVLGPDGDMYRVHLANGNEKITWNNGSIHTIEAVTEKSGHGASLDLAVIDEAWSHVDAKTEQSLKPAMITRPSAQLFIPSTAGSFTSHYFRAKVEMGRAAVDADRRSGIAYFEWSAADGLDPADPETWRSCMPALGHTITEEAVAADYESMRANPGEFERAYLNRWPEARAVEQAIPSEIWEACAVPEAQFDGNLVWAIDSSPEDHGSSIAAAGFAVDGGELIEVIAHKAGSSSWLVPRLTELSHKHGGKIVALDGQGPAKAHIPDLEAAGFTVIKLSSGDLASACMGLYNAAVSTDDNGYPDRLIHLNQTELNVALANADKWKTGDVWKWARTGSGTDISPLYAVTIAHYALQTTGEQWRNVLDSIA